MRASFYSLGVAAFLAVISVPTARAQQQNPDQQPSQGQPAAPIPAYRSPLAGLSGSGDAQDQNAGAQGLVPDNRPLAGAQDLSLGAPAFEHSFWEPNFGVMSTADTNPLTATQTGGWTNYASFFGGVDVQRVSGISDLSLMYVGGDQLLSSDGGIGNSVVQEFELGEKLSWRRSTLSFFDQLGYLPEAFFGFGGFGSFGGISGTGLSGGGINGVGLSGGGTLGLQNVYEPGQSILTTRGQRLINSSIVQVDTLLTPRSSLTFLGGYSLMDFFDNNLLDSGRAFFQAGFNRQMTREDTLAVFYRFSAFQYSDVNQSIKDNSFQVSYGRSITGRLALQVSGGPDVAFLQLALSPSPGSSGGAGGGNGNPPGTTASSASHLYWSIHTALSYQLRRTEFELNYMHGLSEGSGVLAGSISDNVRGAATRQLSRTMNGTFNFGYARNQGLNLASSTPTSQTYNNWFAGVGLTHSWGRSLDLFLRYQLQYQDSNSAFCIGQSCGTSFVRNMISFGLAWNKGPIPF
jgi:hypothetical protein